MNMNRERQTVGDSDAKYFDLVNSFKARYFNNIWRLSMPPLVNKDNFTALGQIQSEIVSSCPVLNMLQFETAGGNIGSRDNEVSVVSIFTKLIAVSYGAQIGRVHNIRRWSDG